jgi:hypothetical protein
MRTTTLGRTAEEDFDSPAADPLSVATAVSPAARAARTIQRVEAAIAGSVPRRREIFVKGK